MNKYIKLSLAAALFAFAAVSCKNDDVVGAGAFSVDKTTLSLTENGGEEVLSVIANGDWTTSIDATWLHISPASGNGSQECVITVDNSVEETPREANLYIRNAEGEQKAVKVLQNGHKLAIVAQVTDTIISNSAMKEQRFLKFKVLTNVQFDVKMEYDYTDWDNRYDKAEWLTYDNSQLDFNLEYGARPTEVEVSIPWNTNMYPHERIANITFEPRNSDKEVVVVPLKVTQNAAPVITDDRAGDSLALLTIHERLNCWTKTWDETQNMKYWSGVSLWEKTDKEVRENPALLGRVRAVSFQQFSTEETIPFEIKYLKYLETLYFMGNANPMLLNIELGDDVCELAYLKNLTIAGYGLVKLPSNLKKLKNLQRLDLNSNNLTYDAIRDLTQQNFPKLKTLRLNASRRHDYNRDMTKTGNTSDAPDGLRIDVSSYSFINQFLKWDNLDTLQLSVCYLEGELPSDDDLLDYYGFDMYTYADIKESKKNSDKKQWLSESLAYTPKVLPNTKFFAVNLNFLEGRLPDWVLYHPNLLEWNPFTFIFTQEEGTTASGKTPGFTNAPNDFSYYYEAYPEKGKWEAGEEDKE